eukprot:Skav221212  [mRNA]  locus=scaffold2467:141955:143483:- [translate_table: standard]
MQSAARPLAPVLRSAVQKVAAEFEENRPTNSRSRGNASPGARRAQSLTEPSTNLPCGRNCPKCRRPRRVCLCEAIPKAPQETRTQVVLFTHPKELKRSLCTGPLLELCLKRIIKMVGKAFPDPEEDPALHAQLSQGGRECFLMYPGPKTFEVSEIARTQSPVTLILIDARWQQARIMLNRSTWLQALPRVSLPHQQSGYVWRQQPAPGFVSTLEAVSEALNFLEDEGAHIKASLLRPFEKMVQLQCQFTPNAQDKNANLGELALPAKENANPLWNRSRRRKRQWSQSLDRSTTHNGELWRAS